MGHLQWGRAGRIPVSRETPLRAWLPGRSERQFSVPSGILVQFLHELVAPIRHDLSTSPVRPYSTRKEQQQSSARKAPIFMPLGACQGITIPTKQKRRSTGQGAKKPLDPQRPEKRWVPAGASGHELSRPKRVSWLPAYGMMAAMSIPVSCVGVKTHVFMNDLVVDRWASDGESSSHRDCLCLHGV